jgi:integrase
MNQRMSMQQLASRYLAQKRALGYAMRFCDGPLMDFARMIDRSSLGGPITVHAACRWAAAIDAAPSYRAKRLSLVRNFSRFCIAYDPRTQVPPDGLLGPSTQRIRPHIYSTAQIRDLLHNARRLKPVFSPLRSFTYETLIGLLAVTGLRRSEVLRLRLEDFDAQAGTLRIARSKFAPERFLPLHPSTVKALARYLKNRRRLLPFGDYLFVGHRGQPIPAGTLQQTFRQLIRNVPSNGARSRPRIHDLRHSFATRLIATWNRQARPFAHRLLLLSRYMGHRHFHDTWWYVSSDPHSLRLASNQFDRFRHGRHQLER